jgi:outer membrane lipoprotein-sorting protein
MLRRTTLLSFAAATMLFSVACAQNQKVATETNANTISSTPPFETNEPERYRATRIITIVAANGQTLVTKYSIARDGDLRRDESDSTGQHVVYLTLAEERFVLFPDEKIFAAVTNEDLNTGEQEAETSPDRLLHTELVTPGYQKLGAETIAGRNLQKYRVVVNSSAGENVSVGETLLWFDEALHMPVRTEISSPNGTHITTELADVVLSVDPKLFEIPKDFQKIDFQKLRERLNTTNPKPE